MSQGKVERLEAEIERLRRIQFQPAGDNHHNAALCPYCSPEREEQDRRLRERESAIDKVVEELEGTVRDLAGMQGRQANGEPHSKAWLQGEAHEIHKRLDRLLHKARASKEGG